MLGTLNNYVVLVSTTIMHKKEKECFLGDMETEADWGRERQKFRWKTIGMPWTNSDWLDSWGRFLQSDNPHNAQQKDEFESFSELEGEEMTAAP